MCEVFCILVSYQLDRATNTNKYWSFSGGDVGELGHWDNGVYQFNEHLHREEAQQNRSTGASACVLICSVVQWVWFNWDFRCPHHHPGYCTTPPAEC